MSENRKSIPKSVLIFGAAAHIGGPLATFLTKQAPSIRLRLATSNTDKSAALERAFPNAEVVIANYSDVESLKRAADGMEGVFTLTASGTDERPAMTNLVAALKAAGTAVHVLRLVGLQPEASLRRIPKSLVDGRLGLPIQHPIAKQILDESDLPVTYLNSGATFIDNFRWMKEGLRTLRTLIWPEHMIPFIDPHDIGEVAGRLLLSDNHRHIGQFHTMNNGHDIMRYKDVAQLMSEVWGVPIAFDGSKERFLKQYAHMGEPRLHALWNFFKYEEDNEVVWARNDFVERTLGRKPKTVRDWLIEHRDELIGPAA